MKVVKTDIDGLLILEPKVFGDARGFFYESFNQQVFNAATGLDVQFVQDNHSRSAKGVLRGLHYQLPPFAQGKLVRCVRGAVFDVAVDIRSGSPTFGKWAGVELSEDSTTAVLDSARICTRFCHAHRYGGLFVQDHKTTTRPRTTAALLGTILQSALFGPTSKWGGLGTQLPAVDGVGVILGSQQDHCRCAGHR
jgi:dTDP-4-dehydrorhamnose 3,5-epimerase